MKLLLCALALHAHSICVLYACPKTVSCVRFVQAPSQQKSGQEALSLTQPGPQVEESGKEETCPVPLSLQVQTSSSQQKPQQEQVGLPLEILVRPRAPWRSLCVHVGIYESVSVFRSHQGFYLCFTKGVQVFG